jgi:uncharacterized protein YggE
MLRSWLAERTWLAIPLAVVVAAGTTVATSASGQSAAGTTDTLAAPTITVNGSANVTDTVANDDNSSPQDAQQEQASYQAALGQALANAKTKAQFIAGQEGVTLGAVESVVEQSDVGSGCGGPVEFAASGVAAPTAHSKARSNHKSHPTASKKGKTKKASAAAVPRARASLVAACIENQNASVTVTYLIGAAAPAGGTTGATGATGTTGS